MAVYIVTADVHDAARSAGLVAAIAGYKSTCCLQPNSWLVHSNDSAEAIRDAVSPSLAPGDRLLVGHLAGAAAWVGHELAAADWIFALLT